MRTDKVYKIHQMGILSSLLLGHILFVPAGACLLLSGIQWHRGERYVVLASVGLFFVACGLINHLLQPHLTVVIDSKGISWGPIWARQFVPWSQITYVSEGQGPCPLITVHMAGKQRSFRILEWCAITSLRLALGGHRRAPVQSNSIVHPHPIFRIVPVPLLLVGAMVFGMATEWLEHISVLTGLEDKGLHALGVGIITCAAFLVVRPSFAMNHDFMSFGQIYRRSVKIRFGDVTGVKINRSLDSSGREQITSLTVLSGKIEEDLPTYLPNFPEVAENVLKRLPSSVRSQS